MLNNKASLNKFNKTEIIGSIFSDHNGMELEINYRKKTEKKNAIMQIQTCYLMGISSMKKSKQKLKKKNTKANENGNTTYTIYGMQQKQFQEGSLW